MLQSITKIAENRIETSEGQVGDFHAILQALF